MAVEEGLKVVPAGEGVGVAFGKPPGADVSRAAPEEVHREEATEEEEEQDRSWGKARLWEEGWLGRCEELSQEGTLEGEGRRARQVEGADGRVCSAGAATRWEESDVCCSRDSNFNTTSGS